MTARRALTTLTRARAACWDAASWWLATAALVAAHNDFAEPTRVQLHILVAYGLAAMVFHVVLGWLVGLYRRDRRGQITDETLTLALVVAVAGALVGMYLWTWGGATFPRGIAVSVPPAAMLAMLAGRMIARARRPDPMRSVSLDDLSDLLERPSICTRTPASLDYLSGKVVLVTGAGGSIGSEIARQVAQHGPQELVLLDRDESGLAEVSLSIYHQALFDTDSIVLCDIRDPDAVTRAFARHRPQVVFHAAALKHLALLERYPAEAWQTNVIGTLNVLEASREVGVERFVTISTDKAADATSVLGTTKRIAERLTAQLAATTGRAYLSVRFGNVLGSRGSVLATFAHQINAGVPLTATHPDAERFVMTIPEACELALQSGAIGEGGEVLAFDMGTPVAISDLAERLIARSGTQAEIVYTGLRPGEKLTETLFGRDEHPEPTSHPSISRVSVPPLSLTELASLAPADPTVAPLTKQTPSQGGQSR